MNASLDEKQEKEKLSLSLFPSGERTETSDTLESETSQRRCGKTVADESGSPKGQGERKKSFIL